MIFNKTRKTKDYLKGYNQCFREKLLERNNRNRKHAEEIKAIHSEYKQREIAEKERTKENNKRAENEVLQSEQEKYTEIINHLKNRIAIRDAEIEESKKEKERMKKDYRKFIELRARLNYVIPRIGSACEKWSEHTGKEAARINQEFQDIKDEVEFIDLKTANLENKKFKELGQ